MRLSLRFILPLICALSLIAYAVVPIVNTLTFKWFVNDTEIRSEVVTNTLHDSLVQLLKKPSPIKIRQLFNRAIKDDRIYALGFCTPQGQLKYATSLFPKKIKCEPPDSGASARGRLLQRRHGLLHLAYHAVISHGKVLGEIVLIHDMSFAQRRTSETQRYVFYFFIILGVIIAIVTVIVAQLSWKGWIRGLRSVMRGEGLLRPMTLDTSAEIRPIVKDLRELVRDIDTERRARDESQITWTPRALKEILHNELAGDEVLIVSNREPYIHVKKDGQIEIHTPASGLVTALEPIMRACSGTWIAHGSGNADRESVDKKDHVRVPPENPSYQIRRVWLSKDEEAGYYYGFANEGLWALCHIAHVRPIFRSRDWQKYVAVNKKFAQAVAEEATTDDPVILVQDYHLALLPKMIRELLPKATVITFWHIPFPNPEVFGICPWREELLKGLLGSSILGFHTRFHCHNFMDTVDRFLESRVSRESMTISRKGEQTAVMPYPISIEYPVKWLKTQKAVVECRTHIRRMHDMPNNHLIGLGVDRLDYTKGILERFRAVERLLELEPTWVGKFSYIQIAAPSRTSIDEYRRFDSEVRELATKINQRFGQDGYEPIHLKIEYYDPPQIYEFFRACDVCFVGSLHDGMNLVAKEFIASRDDEQGVLILSQFAGASRELPEALIVNPYNIDQCAAALHVALEMPRDEQRNRMRSMRGLIQEFNVYRWAGRMLLDAARLRRRSRLFEDIESGDEDRTRFRL